MNETWVNQNHCTDYMWRPRKRNVVLCKIVLENSFFFTNIWAHRIFCFNIVITGFVAKNNTTFRLKDAKELMYAVFGKITKDVLTKAEEHVVKIEKEYCKENCIDRSVLQKSMIIRYMTLLSIQFSLQYSFSILTTCSSAFVNTSFVIFPKTAYMS
jgi:hypothetical protein